MKAIITGLLGAIMLFAGCATLQNQDRTERLASKLESVAFIGTVKVIENNPEVKIVFQQVHQELVEQEERGSITYETLVSILRRLPIEEMEGDDGLLVVEAGRIIFNPDGESAIDLGETGDGLMTLAGGIRRGIKRGIAWTES